jgi:hypothetical protein
LKYLNHKLKLLLYCYTYGTSKWFNIAQFLYKLFMHEFYTFFFVYDPVFLGQQRPAGTPPFSISSLTGPAITSAAPTLPVQPRIEPRVLALR